MVGQAVESCQQDVSNRTLLNWLWRNTAVIPTDLIARRPRLGERSAWYKCAKRRCGGVYMCWKYKQNSHNSYLFFFKHFYIYLFDL